MRSMGRGLRARQSPPSSGILSWEAVASGLRINALGPRLRANVFSPPAFMTRSRPPGSKDAGLAPRRDLLLLRHLAS